MLWGPREYTITDMPGELHPLEYPVLTIQKGKKKISLKLRFRLTCNIDFEALKIPMGDTKLSDSSPESKRKKKKGANPRQRFNQQAKS